MKHELYTRFLLKTTDSINKELDTEKKEEMLQSLDVVMAIHNYRLYPSVIEAAKHCIISTDDEDYVMKYEQIITLWSHFNELNTESLCELYVSMMEEATAYVT